MKNPKELEVRARELKHDLYMMGHKNESEVVHKSLTELMRLCNQYEKVVKKELDDLYNELKGA